MARTPHEQDLWEMFVNRALGPLDPEYVKDQKAFEAELLTVLGPDPDQEE